MQRITKRVADPHSSNYLYPAMRRLLLAALVPVLVTVVARQASAAPVVPVSAITRPVADTTFKPEGSYSLNLTVSGEAMSMTFTVEKKADGTFAGVFRNAELGDLPTTGIKVEGRTLTIGVQSPVGPAQVTLTVKSDNAVEGEWSMAGDGSKVAGKKDS
jgi:hypothetical protein